MVVRAYNTMIQEAEVGEPSVSSGQTGLQTKR